MTKSEAIQAFQAVLALNNISLINIGDKFVKALPSDQANGAGAALDYSTATDLPEMGSYVTHIVQLKYIKPSEMVPVIQPFAKLNSIIPLDVNGIIVIRDYAENVKRMLEMVQQVDVSVPAEYISEVIPIRYAMAEDIASALNSLGGSGGSTVSFGGSGASPTVNGVRSPGGVNGMSGAGGAGGAGGYGGGNQPNQSRQFGTQGAQRCLVILAVLAALIMLVPLLGLLGEATPSGREKSAAPSNPTGNLVALSATTTFVLFLAMQVGALPAGLVFYGRMLPTYKVLPTAL